MNSVGLHLASIFFAIAASTSASAASFEEGFQQLAIYENATALGSPLTCSGGVPLNTLEFSPDPSAANQPWVFHSSGIYPLVWWGNNASQAWAVAGGQMYFHGVYGGGINNKGPYDHGHAILTRQTFARNKTLIAQVDIRAYCSNGGSGCWAGIALINQESNYRGLYLASVPGNSLTINRLAPCNEWTAGTTVGANSWQSLAVEYNPQQHQWRYFHNGQVLPAMTSLTGGAPSSYHNGIESGAVGNSDVALSADPRLGIYTNVNFLGGFVEGGVRNVRVFQIDRVQPAGVTASSSYLPAVNAVDGNPFSAWVSYGGGSQWIEVDLGRVVNVRRIRLLTEQSFTEYTSHEVYTGLAPAPSNQLLTFAGTTSTNQWLEQTFLSAPVSARYIRVHTSVSNSWRAWREIEVFEEL